MAISMNKFGLKGLTFKSNSITYSLSIILLVFFIIYSLTALGVAGTLFSSALGLIAYGIFGTVESAMAVTILAGILLKVAFPGFKKAAEGFKDGGAGAAEAAEAKSGSGEEISDVQKPSPVHGATEEDKDKHVALAEAKDIAGFADKANTDGLFKLGELPSEAKDGNYIDVGTTIMRSLSALKPDQLNQMTADTRTLLETQKSLMGMLTTMKPMLSDGQQLLTSLSGLFKQ
jgi:hypothetical protein